MIGPAPIVRSHTPFCGNSSISIQWKRYLLTVHCRRNCGDVVSPKYWRINSLGTKKVRMFFHIQRTSPLAKSRQKTAWSLHAKRSVKGHEDKLITEAKCCHDHVCSDRGVFGDWDEEKCGCYQCRKASRNLDIWPVKKKITESAGYGRHNASVVCFHNLMENVFWNNRGSKNERAKGKKRLLKKKLRYWFTFAVFRSWAGQ